MHGRKEEKKEEERKRGTGGGREGGRKDVIKSLPKVKKLDSVPHKAIPSAIGHLH